MKTSTRTMIALTALAAVLASAPHVLFSYDDALAEQGGNATEAAELAQTKAAAALAEYDAALDELNKAQSDLEAAKDAFPGNPHNADLLQVVKDSELAVIRAEAAAEAAEAMADQAQADVATAEWEAQAALIAVSKKTPIDAETQAALNAVVFSPDGDSNE